MNGNIGVLTIGQSPRNDVTPSIQAILGDSVSIKERGGLDSLTEQTLKNISPESSSETYISKLRNGCNVKIAKDKLLPLLQHELMELEKEVDVVIMLCTGDFPTLKTSKPIIFPDKVLSHTIQAIKTDGNLGLIIPLEEQRKTLVEKWKDVNMKPVVEVASPYESSDIQGAAQSLREQGASLIVLDCMGYNEFHKEEAKEVFQGPVILPRTLTARIAAEYVR